jgi:dephospho-CoA kinase
MKIIGITGSIGMGKSTMCRILRQMGVVSHSSDEAVHFMLSPRGKAFRDVALLFPDAWNSRTHEIDRKKLGEIIFQNPQAKQALESLLHPLVQWSQFEFIKKARRMGLKKIALDIPLLFETNAQSRVDTVINVSAPYHVQKLRVLKRSGYSVEKFHSILKTQMPSQVKRKLSDNTIETGLGQAYTTVSIKKFLRKL